MKKEKKNFLHLYHLSETKVWLISILIITNKIQDLRFISSMFRQEDFQNDKL